MEIKEIQDKLTEAHSLYVERTGKQPLVSPYLHISGHGKLYANVLTTEDEDRIQAAADTIPATLDALIAGISAMPTGEEKALRDFQRDLAKLIDKGNAAGIPVEFVNPLTEMARKLAENAITDQREAERKPVAAE